MRLFLKSARIPNKSNCNLSTLFLYVDSDFFFSKSKIHAVCILESSTSPRPLRFIGLVALCVFAIFLRPLCTLCGCKGTLNHYLTPLFCGLHYFAVYALKTPLKAILITFAALCACFMLHLHTFLLMRLIYQLNQLQ